jgi:YD repeat-containing protein
MWSFIGINKKSIMKKVVVCIALSSVLAGYGQNTSDRLTKSLPDIVRPSPTVSQLMKIEESQLDNFTGQPQIALPLYNKKMGKMQFDLALSYNSSGIRVSESSGWVGRGWVLSAGGVISRSVIDLPDEINTAIHKGTNYNNYYNFFNYPIDSEERREFSYDVQWRKDVDLDSKNDVYQFNFMGKVGRFVFAKVGNILRPSIIGEDFDFSIEAVYANTPSPFYPLEITSFIITDESGYRYYFTETDRTEKKDITFVYMQDGCNNQVAPQEASQIGKFISAWHLSKVEDENGQELLNITYADVLEKPRAAMSRTNYFARHLNTIFSSSFPECTMHMKCALKPQKIAKQPFLNIESKKISRISFRDKSYIQFTLSGSHPDYIDGQGSYLTKIGLYNGYEQTPVKTFDFNYAPGSTLFLEKVKFNQSENQSYAFEYFDKDNYPGYSSFDRTYLDIFGYPNIGDDKESMCTGVLTKVVYPTKGIKEFQWEPNTYSYKGDQLLSFQEIFTNPDNYSITAEGVFDPFMNDANNTTRPYHLMQVNFEQDAFIYSSTSSTGTFDFVIPNSVQIRPIVSYTDHSLDPNRPIMSYPIGINEIINKTIHLKPGLYKIYFHSLNLGLTNTDKIKGNIDIRIKHPKQTLNWFLYGGGIRIKSIKDNDHNINQLVKGFEYNFENPEIIPSDLPPYLIGIQGSYILNFSSGSLDGVDNLLKKYNISVKPIFNVPYTDPFSVPEIEYDVEERQSELDAQLSKGSFIGYKNVFEYFYPNTFSLQGEFYKSKIKYSYDSAIDFPSQIANNVSLPIRSVDFKHASGLVKSEDFKYNYDDNIEIRQLVNRNFYALGNENYFSGFCQQIRELFTSYQRLKINLISASQYSIDCSGQPSILAQSFQNMDKSNCIDNLTEWYLAFEDYKQKVQIIEYLKKEYFPTGTIVHKENYLYRNSYKRLFSKISTLYNGETSEVRYYFPQDNEMVAAPMRAELIGKNIVTPLKMETFRNGGLIAAIETRYGSFIPVEGPNLKGAASYILPQYIFQGKESNLEKKVTFNSYDSNGNILQYTEENGVPISFVWGYSKSELVAKIENLSYASIPSNLITDVQSATDAFPLVENSLRSSLIALRGSPSLSGATVTTFTYRPLFGVCTVTDPKGYLTSYKYDEFGRLEQVKDNDGNFLSEYKYIYRP